MRGLAGGPAGSRRERRGAFGCVGGGAGRGGSGGAGDGRTFAARFSPCAHAPGTTSRSMQAPLPFFVHPCWLEVAVLLRPSPRRPNLATTSRWHLNHRCALSQMRRATMLHAPTPWRTCIQFWLGCRAAAQPVTSSPNHAPLRGGIGRTLRSANAQATNDSRKCLGARIRARNRMHQPPFAGTRMHRSLRFSQCARAANRSMSALQHDASVWLITTGRFATRRPSPE